MYGKAPFSGRIDPMPRPQFTLRALLVLMLAVACFFGGIRFERERQRQQDEASDYDQVRPPFRGVVEIFEPTTCKEASTKSRLRRMAS